MNYYTYNTKFGLFTFVEKDGVIVRIVAGKKEFDGNYQETPLFQEMNVQLNQYFQGKRKTFEIPFEITGTAFQIKVLTQVIKIPYGNTISYKQLGAPRAVANALHNNPLLFVVPCHRVIGSNGKLCGYVLGLEWKERLLKMEGSL